MKPTICLLHTVFCATLALPAAAQGFVVRDESGEVVNFYGQIDLAFRSVNDGVEIQDNVIDNTNSVTRFGFWIGPPLVGLDLRFNFESGQSDEDPRIEWNRTNIRKLEVVHTGRVGVFSLGQGSMATDGAAEVDNSGTTVAGYVSVAETTSSFQFRDGDALSDITLGEVFQDFDGSRKFRVRYDTPDWSGFYFSAAYGQDILADNDDANYYDAAIRYGNEGDSVTFDAALGYRWKELDGDTTEHAIASGSLTHVPTGLNVTLAAGEAQGGGGNYGYVKLGWNGDLIRYGGTAISLDYYDGSNFVTPDSSSRSWGVQAVQTFDERNLDAFLGYRIFSYDDNTAADYHDIASILVGARWKF